MREIPKAVYGKALELGITAIRIRVAASDDEEILSVGFVPRLQEKCADRESFRAEVEEWAEKAGYGRDLEGRGFEGVQAYSFDLAQKTVVFAEQEMGVYDSGMRRSQPTTFRVQEESRGARRGF